jgi:hypothetical protein
MKKADMNKLLEKIEDYYERNEQLFLDCSEKETNERELSQSQSKEEDEGELELMISSLGSQKVSRPVHMPGYPE